jgi:hypothetical protein
MITDDMHNWKDSYPHLSKIINQMGLRVGVELGVAAGRHSRYILENTGIDKLWSIDRWQHVSGYDDEMNLPQNEHDELYLYVCSALSRFGARSSIIRSDTTLASTIFADKTLDFVYVDADHSYEGCKKDLLAWIPKIRPGGIISGHDLNWSSVNKAITEVIPQFGIKSVIPIGEACWAQIVPEIK